MEDVTCCWWDHLKNVDCIICGDEIAESTYELAWTFMHHDASEVIYFCRDVKSFDSIPIEPIRNPFESADAELQAPAISSHN